MAGRLDETLRALAQRRVESWRADEDGPEHPEYARRWQELLSRPLPDIRRALTADTPEMRAMRQTSPFAGAVSEEERLAVIREIP